MSLSAQINPVLAAESDEKSGDDSHVPGVRN